MPTSTQSLINGAACYDCTIPQGMRLSVLIYLFAQIAGVTNVQTLMNGAACYDCTIPDGMKMSVLLYLADAISTGGGSGATEVFSLAGGNAPANVPTGAGVSYNANGQVWVWNTVSQAWEQIIG